MALENLIMSILNIIYALIMPMCVTYVTGRDDREADCAALEMLCTARYRGFESRPLRHEITIDIQQ